MLTSQFISARATDDIHSAFNGLGKAGKVLATRILVLKSELLCVMNQPPVRFYDQGLTDRCFYQDRINFALHSLRDHASFYQTTLVPDLLRRLSDIDEYFTAQNNLCNNLAAGCDHKQAITLLQSLQQQHRDCRAGVIELINHLDHFRASLCEEACHCDTTTKNLSGAMNGDRVLLTSIQQQLASLDNQISHITTETAFAGLANEKVSFIITVGHIAELFTTSNPTYLVLGGAGLIAIGLEGETTDTVRLASLISQRSQRLAGETALHKEVVLAQGITSGLNRISSEAKVLLDSLHSLVTAWDTLDHRTGIINNRIKKWPAQSGIITTVATLSR